MADCSKEMAHEQHNNSINKHGIKQNNMTIPATIFSAQD